MGITGYTDCSHVVLWSSRASYSYWINYGRYGSRGRLILHFQWRGYVTSRQDGKYVLYRITDERVRSILQLAKEIVGDNAEHIHSCTRM